jgi:hypothetical protein
MAIFMLVVMSTHASSNFRDGEAHLIELGDHLRGVTRRGQAEVAVQDVDRRCELLDAAAVLLESRVERGKGLDGKADAIGHVDQAFGGFERPLPELDQGDRGERGQQILECTLHLFE